MKIFKELNKLGYNHYTEHTVEELDDLPLDSEERIMEQALVLRWFEDNHSLYIQRIVTTNANEVIDIEYNIKSWRYPHITIEFDNPYDAFDKNKAELACLKKLIELQMINISDSTTTDQIDGIIFDLPFDDKIKLWELIDKLVLENKTEISASDFHPAAVKEYENVGDEKLFPNHSDKDIWMNGFYEGAKWYRDTIKTIENYE
jgi:hypothetical protein